MKQLCVDHMPVGAPEGAGLELSTKADCQQCQPSTCEHPGCDKTATYQQGTAQLCLKHLTMTQLDRTKK